MSTGFLMPFTVLPTPRQARYLTRTGSLAFYHGKNKEVQKCTKLKRLKIISRVFFWRGLLPLHLGYDWVCFILFSFTLPIFTIKDSPKAQTSHANLNFPNLGYVWIQGFGSGWVEITSGLNLTCISKSEVPETRLRGISVQCTHTEWGKDFRMSPNPRKKH